MATVNKEKICWASTAIHTVLSGNVDPFQATTKIDIEYLTNYFHTGVGYSSVNTARSVLSTIIKTENEIPFGELPLVRSFLKGVFNLRPALPRYSTTVVLKYIKSLKPLKQCDLKSLSSSSKTFAKHYNKLIVDESGSFSRTVLES